MTAKRVVKSEDASAMPLVELAGKIQLADVDGDAKALDRCQALGRNADMQRKWGQYLAYRADAKLPLTVRALKAHLVFLAELHPNPSEAYHALHYTMSRGKAAENAWQFPVAMPKAWPRKPLPGHAAALAAAGLKADSPAATASAADLEALEEYKRRAEDMIPADRARLLKAFSDVLPALAGSLAARITLLNQRDAKARPAGAALDQVAKDLAQGMRADLAETSPRTWHNRMQAAGKTDTDGTDDTDLQREDGR